MASTGDSDNEAEMDVEQTDKSDKGDKTAKAAKADKDKGDKKESKEDKKESKEDLTNPDVVTKYRLAADIANATLALVIKACAPGKRVVELCSEGDKYIQEAVSKVYNKGKGKEGGKIEKGIGFPTCVSVNNLVGHFSPLSADQTALKPDDLIKIDLGVHIDGYISVVAHTFILPDPSASSNSISAPTQAIKEKQANVIAAAYTAAEAALRLLKPGNKNNQITEMIKSVADEFKVNVVQGVLSHEMKRFVIDGEKVIISKTEIDQKVDEFDFEPNQVFAIDIVMSSGEGKPKEMDERMTVYKRALETTYKLKSNISRQILSEIDKNFPTFPFTIRALDEKKARFAIKECKNHDLVFPYPVLAEKDGDLVAHFKYTALLLPSGTIKITGPPVDLQKLPVLPQQVKSVAIKSLLTQSVKKKQKKNKKKKKADTTNTALPNATSSSSSSTMDTS